MTIDQALGKACKRLLSESSRLDAELLLCHILKCNRSYLYVHPSHQLTIEQQSEFEALIHRRSQGEPVAYLTGRKGFWTFDLTVSKDVLIPRPETECLVEKAMELINGYHSPLNIADIATGSGAIALALASEYKQHTIIATDISKPALAIATLNASHLNLNHINFIASDLCSCFAHKALDILISNPPYIAENDPHLSQDGICFEPRSALISPLHGLSHIKRLIHQANYVLKTNGIILIEHGFDQATAVHETLYKHNFNNISTGLDLSGHERFTFATHKA